ncbi:MAG: pyridoxal kinase [Candidatus Phytoplasma sp. TWB_XP]
MAYQYSSIFNHTGYQKWQGQIFNKQNIVDLAEGLFALGVEKQCQAILTGYMGSLDICEAVLEIVARFKRKNPDILYLCDPVMGNNRCFVKPEITSFFKNNLQADIITPNQFEVEFLSGIKINNVSDAIKVVKHFHNLGVKIVIITGINFQDEKNIFKCLHQMLQKNIWCRLTTKKKTLILRVQEIYLLVFF